MKSYMAGAVLMLLMLITLTGCSGGDEAADSGSAASEATPTEEATSTPEVATPTIEQPTQVPLDTDVFATGYVEARQDADLVFQVNGQVGEVLVREGDVVTKGQVLAVLDTRPFDQAVRDAEAALISARADQLALVEDPVPEQVQAAQASIAQASGQLNQVQGSVTNEDIAAAQSRLEEARAALADLEEGADHLDIEAAQNRVHEARIALQNTRDQLSHQKTQAEIDVQRSTEALQTAQVEYSAAYWDWRYVRDHGKAPPANEQQARVNPPLTDHSEQSYRDQLNKAENALQQAEDNLQSAQKAYEQAQQAEITGIQDAEARVRDAEIALDQVLEPAEADQLAAARARVADAEAQLAKLRGQQREGQLQAAQAGVAQAQANLEQLYSEPTESQAIRAEAGIARAEVNLAQAQLNREYAEIRAPFEGEVAVINIDPGDPGTTAGAGGQPAIRLVDLSELFVEVEVTDADIARVRLGQEAEVVADALPGEAFTGDVTFIAPASTRGTTGITKYTVRIELDNSEEVPLRVGMSVSVTINTGGN